MTDALTLEPKSQFRNWHPRKPIKELDDRGLKMVEAMTFGVDEAEAAELGVAPYTPLPIEKAADASGLKRRNARWLYTQPVFLSAYSKALANVRSSHKARAVATMAAIMDEPGENTAADRTVRLKAAQALIGDSESKAGTNINITNQTLNLTAGVVVRLPSDVPVTPLEQQPKERGDIIDAIPIEQHEQSEGFSIDPDAHDEMARRWPNTQSGE
jgi:hypothetical protein